MGPANFQPTAVSIVLFEVVVEVVVVASRLWLWSRRRRRWTVEESSLEEEGFDFPKRKKLEPELQKQNQQLAQMFQVRGYPSGWFVIPEISEGKTNFNRLGSQGYVRGGVNAWIEGAKNILNKK